MSGLVNLVHLPPLHPILRQKQKERGPLLLDVASFLDFSSLFALERTCKPLQAFISQGSLWKVFAPRVFPFDHGNTEKSKVKALRELRAATCSLPGLNSSSFCDPKLRNCYAEPAEDHLVIYDLSGIKICDISINDLAKLLIESSTSASIDRTRAPTPVPIFESWIQMLLVGGTGFFHCTATRVYLFLSLFHIGIFSKHDGKLLHEVSCGFIQNSSAFLPLSEKAYVKGIYEDLDLIVFSDGEKIIALNSQNVARTWFLPDSHADPYFCNETRSILTIQHGTVYEHDLPAGTPQKLFNFPEWTYNPKNTPLSEGLIANDQLVCVVSSAGECCVYDRRKKPEKPFLFNLGGSAPEETPFTSVKLIHDTILFNMRSSFKKTDSQKSFAHLLYNPQGKELLCLPQFLVSEVHKVFESHLLWARKQVENTPYTLVLFAPRGDFLVKISAAIGKSLPKSREGTELVALPLKEDLVVFSSQARAHDEKDRGDTKTP